MSEPAKIFYVRLKPCNPKRGNTLKRFTAFSQRFDEAVGWYKVPEVVMDFEHKTKEPIQVNIIDYLRAVRNDETDPDSPLAFDVVDSKEAADAVDRAEKKAKEKRVAAADASFASLEQPVDLTTRELRTSTRPTNTVPVEAPTSAPAIGEGESTPARRGPGRPPGSRKRPLETAAE